MNYKKIYDQLVEKCRVRGLDKSALEGYYEKHHIIPRCLGGGNGVSNLVMFTGREHFVAHMLLMKAYPENISLMRAAFMMSSRWSSGALYEVKPIHSKTYETMRTAYAKAVSDQCSGENNPMFGVTHPPETMERIRSTRKETERKKRLINWKRNNSEYMAQFKYTPDVIQEFEHNLKCDVKPLHAKYDLDLWMTAEQIKSFWERSGKPDKKFLCNQIKDVCGVVFPQHRLKVMMEKFLSDWEPSLDSSYILTALCYRSDESNKRLEDFEVGTQKTLQEVKIEYFDKWLNHRDLHRQVILNYIQLNSVEKHKLNSKAKLSLVDVIEASLLWKSEKVEQKQIADLLGVARNSISNALEAEGRWLSARHAANALANTHFKELLNE